MGTVTVSLPSDGTTADVGDYNTPITTIVNAINGNLDNSNIASGAAIDGSKLASGTIGSNQVAVGSPVQIVTTNFNAVATGTTQIPFDDTKPQSTEGDQYMTQTVTPKSTTNHLYIEATIMLGHSTANNFMTVALFQDSGTDALAATSFYGVGVATGTMNITLRHDMVAGTISATTFKIRAGMGTAGTTTFNGQSGNRVYGGVTVSNIKITEYKA